MNAIAARIDSRLSELNKIRADIVRATGIGESSLRGIWAREDSVPNALFAIKIARFLGVSVEWLVTGEDSSGGPKLMPEEFNLISGFRCLDDRDKKTLLVFLEGLVSQYTGARGASTITG